MLLKIIKPSLFRILLIILLMISGKLYAQEVVDSTKNTTILINNSDHTIIEKDPETDSYVKYLEGNIRIIHDSTFFYCDKAIIRDNDLHATGNVVILQPDSTTLFSDTLKYNADSLKARLNGKVLLLYKGKELRTSKLIYEVDTKIAYYSESGQLKQDSTILRSLNGVYHMKEDLAYFRDFVSINDSTFQLKADSLIYKTGEKMAIFTGPTLITQDSSTIYCESGFFDIDRKNAEFSKDAKYRENDIIATADTIRYFDNSNTYLLSGHAKYLDEEQSAQADSIKYLRSQETSILMGTVDVQNESNQVTGSYVIFDHDSGDFSSNGRSSFTEEEYILTANHIDFKDKEGQGFASGNVFLFDTVSKTSIFSDFLISADSNNSFTAYNDSISRPLMKKVMDLDTLFLSADTLWSFEQIIENDTSQFVNAYHNVKIFHSNYQGISDSMSYSTKDSVFVLYNNPVLWSDSTQFTGDTISIFLANEKIHRLYLRPQGMIISDQSFNLYNQIAGKKINAFFKNDSLEIMKAIGNSASLYYMKDDEGAFIGSIKTICSRMTFLFDDNKLNEVKYFEDPVSNMTTMKQEQINPQKLEGFKWLIDLRPPDKNLNQPILIKKVITEEIEIENEISEEEKLQTEGNTEDPVIGKESKHETESINPKNKDEED